MVHAASHQNQAEPRSGFGLDELLGPCSPSWTYGKGHRKNADDKWNARRDRLAEVLAGGLDDGPYELSSGET